MSLYQIQDCIDKCLAHILHMQLSYDTLHRIQAERNSKMLSKIKIGSIEKQQHETHCRCKHTASKPDRVSLHMMRNDLNVDWLWLKMMIFFKVKSVFNNQCISYDRLTFIRPPLSCSLILRRASTARLISRCKRFPKSLNIVEPPLNTILLYNGRRTSIGQF